MKTNQKRNLRRQEMANQKRKAKKFFKEIWHLEDFSEDDGKIGQRARTRKPCSCYMCGNPRHQHFKSKDKFTMQERKFREETEETEEIEEI